MPLIWKAATVVAQIVIVLMNKKVLLGVSGGVDSSVAAYLLQKQGYEVTGFTLQLWRDELYGKVDHIKKAKEVCRMLGIPHMVLDYSKLFRETVIENFCSEYVNGRTPNPCVVCNRCIKFGKVFDKMQQMDYDYVATGHYSRIVYDENLKRYLIKKSSAGGKDQTYMHYQFSQEQLKHTLFALGDYTKEEVREIAREQQLPTAGQKDSQEICFIENDDYIDFLQKHFNIHGVPGNFVDNEGKVLGRHKGIIHYTIGQRKGLGIAFGEPMFVTGINAHDHTVMLGRTGSEYRKEFVIRDVNFIPFDHLDTPKRFEGKVRYSQKEQPALLTPLENEKILVTFDESQRAVTPGQSAVFYDGDILVGGGIIEA